MLDKWQDNDKINDKINDKKGVILWKNMNLK
jgi:hypothetical protein